MPHAAHCFLMCNNEVLELLLSNLWGIELDVSPLFTEVEMEAVWMHTRLSVVLIGGCLVGAQSFMSLLCFCAIPVAINESLQLHELKSLQV